MRIKSEAKGKAWFGRGLARDLLLVGSERPAGLAWGFTLTPGRSKNLPQAVENRKIRVVAIGERCAAVFGWHAKGEKGKVLGCVTLSFAWSNDSTYFRRIASNHQVARFGERESKATAQ